MRKCCASYFSHFTQTTPATGQLGPSKDCAAVHLVVMDNHVFSVKSANYVYAFQRTKTVSSGFTRSNSNLFA